MEILRSGLVPLPSNDDVLIPRSELSRYLPISPQTAARWASERTGPKFVKVGRRLVAYRVGDLRAWLRAETERHAGGGKR